jgi:hypothetical protein
VKSKPQSSPAARANHARRPGEDPSGAETGARVARSVIELAEPIGSVRQLVIDLPEPTPVTEAEVELLLHWCGDLLADLIEDGTGG